MTDDPWPHSNTAGVTAGVANFSRVRLHEAMTLADLVVRLTNTPVPGSGADFRMGIFKESGGNLVREAASIDRKALLAGPSSIAIPMVADAGKDLSFDPAVDGDFLWFALWAGGTWTTVPNFSYLEGGTGMSGVITLTSYIRNAIEAFGTSYAISGLSYQSRRQWIGAR